jgi:hypothetical protein
MTARTFQQVLAAGAVLTLSAACGEGGAAGSWQQSFDISSCKMLTTGRSEYFILEPGYQLVLEGGDTKVQITVLPETKKVAGIDTRVVEEREWKDGKLYEVAKNYFAICEQTKDVFYFGEHVEFYKDGKVTGHEGTWLAGEKGNQPGLIMPGAPKVGMKYYQEIAPGIAMDRAEVISVSDTCKTPAGTFSPCMKVQEGSAIKFEKEFKYHAPGIGLVRDEDVLLIKHGFAK